MAIEKGAIEEEKRLGIGDLFEGVTEPITSHPRARLDSKLTEFTRNPTNSHET